MKKSYIFFIIILAVFVAGLGIIYRENYKTNQQFEKLSSAPPSQNITQTPSAWISVDFGNGKKREFEGEMDDSTYPFLTAMKSVADTGNFQFKVNDGKFVEIAGIGDSTGKWIVYRNGTEISVPIDKLTIAGGDKYTLSFTK